MKTLKRIIIWLVVLFALLIGVAYLLPSNYHVERSILIKGNGDMIFSMVCDFNNWNYWTPWSAKDDPTAVEEIIGNCEIGAVNRWDGEEMGKGEMIVTKLVPQRMLSWDLKFEDFSQKMIIGMTFEPEGGDWVLTWTADGELGYNPLFRYYGLMIDSDLGADYEKGLQQLKEVCESMPTYPGIKIAEVNSMPAISITDSVTAEEYGPFMESSYGMLYMYAIRNEVEFQGHPYTVYHHWDPEGKILMEVSLPLAEAIPGEDPIKSVMSPGGKAVRAVHRGAYEDIGPAHEAIAKYIEVLELEMTGSPWEVYITDPSQEPDTAKWETVVYYPIK